MKAAVPPDALRCTAVARWSGDGTKRCRKRARGAARFCTMHTRFPPRPRRTSSVLLESLATIVLDERKEIRVEVREREGAEFVSVRLFLDDVPTRRGIFLAPERLCAFADGMTRACERYGS